MKGTASKYILLGLFTMSLFIAKGYDLYNSDNADIIPIYRHAVDASYMQNEFYMDEMDKPSSSRFFIAQAVKGLNHLGLSIELTLLLLYVLAYFLTAYGFMKIARRLSPKEWAMPYMILLAVYYLTDITFQLGVAGFKFSMPLPSTFAAGFCVFAIALAIERKWALSFFMCGLAVLVQAFVGLFFGTAVLVYAIIFMIKEKNLSIKSVMTMLFWLAPAGIAFCCGVFHVVSPLSPAETVDILANLRQPHHNMPVNWRLDGYVEFIVFFVLTRQFYRKRSNLKPLFTLFYITAAIAVLAVFANFFATSVLPLPFLSKLQSGRALAPFLAACLPVWGVKIHELFNKKNKRAYLEAVVLFLALVMPSGIFVAAIYLTLAHFVSSMKASSSVQLILSSITGIVLVILGILVPKYQPTATWMSILVLTVLFMVLMHAINDRSLSALLAASLLLFAFSIWMSGINFIRPTKPHADVYTLAKQFEQLTEDKAIILSDPFMEESLYFRLYANRGTVVSFKCFPHADDGIREWYARLETITGNKLNESVHAGISFNTQSLEQLSDLARRYHASYILAKKSWFSRASLPIALEDKEWAIYEVK